MRPIIGWDVGGAHVKAARLERGRLADVVQWPCPLWQGVDQLEQVLDLAAARWPDLSACGHAVTMTGEMVDCFEHREDGVRRIAALLARRLGAPRFYTHDTAWCGAGQAGERWREIASANWLASASHCARVLPAREGVLVDIGSTTTDLVAFRGGRVLTTSRSDAQRLASGELVYQGVVRTPLCALARRVHWRGVEHNVMNEFFATTADVYRLTAELTPEHDQHPSADGAGKDVAHTQARLARMVGADARDGCAADWLAFARSWRAAQLAELRGQLSRAVAAHRLGPQALAVAAGCGAFLVPELLPDGWISVDYGRAVAPAAAFGGAQDSAHAAAAAAAWAAVAAPAVAVAVLFADAVAGERLAEPC